LNVLGTSKLQVLKLQLHYTCSDLGLSEIGPEAWIGRIPKEGNTGNFGNASLTSSSRLPAKSAPIMVKPVIFLPGRARLATKPC
jgi:hypothetical protein